MPFPDLDDIVNGKFTTGSTEDTEIIAIIGSDNLIPADFILIPGLRFEKSA
jgi:hypothetical protein